MLKLIAEFAFVQIVVLIISASVGADDLDLILSTSQNTVQTGGVVILDIHLHNPTDDQITFELPPTLPCRVISGQTSVVINADLLGGDAMSRLDVPAKGFAKRQCKLSVPAYAKEMIQIRLEAIDTNTLTIPVKKMFPATLVGHQVPLDQGQTLAQSYLDSLSVHQPMYFLPGVDPGLEQTKFQFSFKYRLFNPDGFLAEKAPWVSGLHLGYTQRSIWDLKSDSKPFDDTSYMPELFYLLPKINLNVARISAFGIQGGFQHESNGKGGDDSRSTNILYLKPLLGVHLINTVYLKIAPNLFTYINNSESTNEDLMDYRGYFDLEVGIVDTQGLALNSHFWWATEGASVQLDLTYPMTRLLGKDLNFYLQAQYFSGYAETLLHYNERHDALRIGLSIVR